MRSRCQGCAAVVNDKAQGGGGAGCLRAVLHMACSKERRTLGIDRLRVGADDEKNQIPECRGVDSGVVVRLLGHLYTHSLDCLPAQDVCRHIDVIAMRDLRMLAQVEDVVQSVRASASSKKCVCVPWASQGLPSYSMNKNIERTGWGHVLYEERPGGRRCSYCHALHARRLRLRETLSFPDPVSFLILPLLLPRIMSLPAAANSW